MRPGNMAARAVALIIDGILAFIVLGEAIALLAGQEHRAHGSYGFSLHGGPAFAWLVLAFTYWIVCERLFGATVGKRIFSLRVEGRDGGLPTWFQSVARNLLRIVDGFPYVLPYLVGFVVAKSKMPFGLKATLWLTYTEWAACSCTKPVSVG